MGKGKGKGKSLGAAAIAPAVEVMPRGAGRLSADSVTPGSVGAGVDYGRRIVVQVATDDQVPSATVDPERAHQTLPAKSDGDGPAAVAKIEAAGH